MCVNRLHDHLPHAIRSVLQQDDPDFIFFIIANNCDDALWLYLNGLIDHRIKIYRTHIGQLSFNLNFGLNLIENGYALRMDADDICLPDRLSLTKKYLEEKKWPDVMGGQALLINEEGVHIGSATVPTENEVIRRVLWRKCPMIHPTCALRVQSVLQLRGYLGGFMSEDYDLWLRASRNPKFIFSNIEQPLIKYRISTGQSRGDATGYAEVAGYMLREGLLGEGFRYFAASVLGVAKRYALAKN